MRLSVKLSSSDDSVAEAAGRDMAIALYTYGRVHGIQLQMHESFCGERESPTLGVRSSDYEKFV